MSFERGRPQASARVRLEGDSELATRYPVQIA